MKKWSDYGHIKHKIKSRPGPFSLSSLLLLSFRSSSMGFETGEWRRCRSLSFSPPASLRSHDSRPRPTHHKYIQSTQIQTQVKKARQRLYHLRQLRKFRVSPAILKTFYSGAIESVLTQCISVWYSNATNQDCKALQRVVRLAERISGSALPSPQDIYIYVYAFSRRFYPKRLTVY